MSLIPGLGIAKGMALTLRRFFEPKVTVMYPEDRRDPPHKFRGRLQLLYDEWGTLKCETCFQCAQACPIECIDMGGVDTKGRFHVHWGAPETYGERREESALRRSGRPVPDPAYVPFAAVDIAKVDAVLEEFDFDPARMLDILDAPEARHSSLVAFNVLEHIEDHVGALRAVCVDRQLHVEALLRLRVVSPQLRAQPIGLRGVQVGAAARCLDHGVESEIAGKRSGLVHVFEAVALLDVDLHLAAAHHLEQVIGHGLVALARGDVGEQGLARDIQDRKSVV